MHFPSIVVVASLLLPAVMCDTMQWCGDSSVDKNRYDDIIAEGSSQYTSFSLVLNMFTLSNVGDAPLGGSSEVCTPLKDKMADKLVDSAVAELDVGAVTLTPSWLQVTI